GVGLKAGAVPAPVGRYALAGQEFQRALLGGGPADREVDRRLAKGLAVQQQRYYQTGGGEDGEDRRQKRWFGRAHGLSLIPKPYKGIAPTPHVAKGFRAALGTAGSRAAARRRLGRGRSSRPDSDRAWPCTCGPVPHRERRYAAAAARPHSVA